MTPTPPPPGFTPDVPEITRQILSFLLGLAGGYLLKKVELKLRLRKNVIVKGYVEDLSFTVRKRDDTELDDRIIYKAVFRLIQINIVNDHPRSVIIKDAGFIRDNGDLLSIYVLRSAIRDEKYPLPAKLDDQETLIIQLDYDKTSKILGKDNITPDTFKKAYVIDSTGKKYSGSIYPNVPRPFSLSELSLEEYNPLLDNFDPS